MSDDLRIRHIRDGDWDGIAGLEARAYTALGLSEGRAALESRARVSPATCFVLEVEQRLAGYLLALPYPASQYPDLATAEETVFASDNLHLHDLVVAEDHRGQGLGGRLVRRLAAAAAALGYAQISLVAVGGSDVFWSANGFTADHEAAPAAGYGADSVYMHQAVRADRAGKPEPAGGSPRGSSSPHEMG